MGLTLRTRVSVLGHHRRPPAARAHRPVPNPAKAITAELGRAIPQPQRPDRDVMGHAANDATFWLKEAGLCAHDRMYGCAAFALGEHVRLNPAADSEAARATIADWLARGNEAVRDSHVERAERALLVEREREQRRFAALCRKVDRKSLTASERQELRELGRALDSYAAF